MIKLLIILLIGLYSSISFGQFNFWHGILSGNNSLPYLITASITTGSFSLAQMDFCTRVSLSITDQNGKNFNKRSPTIIPVSGTNGLEIHTSSSCSNSVTSITIPLKTSTIDIYLKNINTSYPIVSTLSFNLSSFFPSRILNQSINYTRPSICRDAYSKNFGNSIGQQLTSGRYIVDPDGSGGNSPFAVYCDMSASPSWKASYRGLTLVGAFYLGSNSADLDGPTSLPTGASYYISNSKYQQLKGIMNYLFSSPSDFAYGNGPASNAVASYMILRHSNSDLLKYENNNNQTSILPKNFDSSANGSGLRTSINGSGHNMWFFSYGQGTNDDYGGLSLNAAIGLVYYRGHTSWDPQPAYYWTGSSFSPVPRSTAGFTFLQKSGITTVYMYIY